MLRGHYLYMYVYYNNRPNKNNKIITSGISYLFQTTITRTPIIMIIGAPTPTAIAIVDPEK